MNNSSYIHHQDRIFVAGHRGMAGSAIVRALKRSGYGNPNQRGKILVVDRADLDLCDGPNVLKWFLDNKPTVVVIAAAKVGGIYANSTFPAEFLLENLKIQNNLIETSWRIGVKRLLFLGSSCIYPKLAKQPIRESELLGGYLESTNENYAIAKIAGIKLCEGLKKQYGFDAISLMPTNLYGPGDNYHKNNSHVMPALIRRFQEAVSEQKSSVTCWGSGTPLREFLHVDDLADACVFALKTWKPDNSEYSFLNVGSGEEVMISKLAEIIANETGFLGEILWDKSKPDGTPRKKLDVSRLSAIGWSAKISLQDGIKDLLSHYRNEKRK